MDNFNLDELNILIDALDELEREIEENRLKRSDIDPDQVRNYLTQVKSLNSKIYGLKCTLEDSDLAKSKN